MAPGRGEAKVPLFVFKNNNTEEKKTTTLLSDTAFHSEASVFSPRTIRTPRAQMLRPNQCPALSSVYKAHREDLKAAQYIDAAKGHLSACDTVTITPRIKSVTKTQRQRKTKFYKECWSTFIFLLFVWQLLMEALRPPERLARPL